MATGEEVEVQPPTVKNNDSSSDDAEDVDTLKKDVAADAGNDEDAAMEWDGNHDDFPMRTIEVKGRSDDPNNKTKFTLNPVVSVFAIAFLWGIRYVCLPTSPLHRSSLNVRVSFCRVSLDQFFCVFVRWFDELIDSQIVRLSINLTNHCLLLFPLRSVSYHTVSGV